MRIVCFGDSNTYGFDPRSFLGSRYPADCRWVDILAGKTGWDVVNEGMNGREVPGSGATAPEDADLFIIMLGTNDLLKGTDVMTITKHMERFLCSFNIRNDAIVLIAPPPMKLGEWVSSQSMIETSIRLAHSYQTLAEKIGIHFIDAGGWNLELAFDGVHFTEKDHRTFAENLTVYLAQLGDVSENEISDDYQ